MSRKIKLDSLQKDDKNFNKHTEQGKELLSESIDRVGVIESITISSDDKIISGNARQEVMKSKFEDVEPIIVETDGTRPVILKRTDIKSNTKEFHEAGLLANTVAKKNINLDLELIEEVMVEEYGLDIEELGVDVYKNDYDVDAFFEEDNTENTDTPVKPYSIVLEYSEEDYKAIIDAFNRLDGSKEAIVYNLVIGE